MQRWLTFVNKWIKLILSVLISGGGLYYAFGQVDIHELWIYLKAVNLVWIFLATLFIIFSIAVRAVRWKLILEPIKSIRFHALFGSTNPNVFFQWSIWPWNHVRRSNREDLQTRWGNVKWGRLRRRSRGQVDGLSICVSNFISPKTFRDSRCKLARP